MIQGRYYRRSDKQCNAEAMHAGISPFAGGRAMALDANIGQSKPMYRQLRGANITKLASIALNR